MASNAFRAQQDATKKITVGAASANVLVGDTPTSLRVVNDGSATVWIKFGSDNSVAADATNDIPVKAGAREVFSLPYPVTGQLYVAAIAAGATGDIYFTPGEGGH